MGQDTQGFEVYAIFNVESGEPLSTARSGIPSSQPLKAGSCCSLQQTQKVHIKAKLSTRGRIHRLKTITSNPG